MRPRFATTLCREGWYYLAIMAMVFAGAMFKEVNLLLVLGGLMLGPLLFNWRVVHLTLKNLEVQRKAPQAVGAGEPLTIGLRLINRRKRFGAWAVTIEEQLHRRSNEKHGSMFWSFDETKILRTAVHFPYVPAGEERMGTYRGRLVERGKYEWGPIRISTRFPFGLFRRTLGISCRDTLYVFPRLGRLTPIWQARHRRALAGGDRRESRPGVEGDFYGVREWRNGDSLRYVHWRSSARTGKLVVRQFEQPRNRDVAILLDLWQAEPGSGPQQEYVELAVSFAATVLNDLCRRGGGKVHLIAGNSKLPEQESSLHRFSPSESAASPRSQDPGNEGDFNGRSIYFGGTASEATLLELMKLLAVLESHSNECLPELIERACKQISVGTEIILISTRRVDWQECQQMQLLPVDPHCRALFRNICCIDTSSEELGQFFEVI